MDLDIVLLPGDGIGPEVVQATVEVIDAVAGKFGHNLRMQEYLIGGVAIDTCGSALPEDTLSACHAADAILLGAVGGPKWDDPTAAVRPEQGLLGLRKELGLFANLRPVKPHPITLTASPLRPERLEGVDLLVVRELTSGIYFGEPRMRHMVDGEIQAVDTMSYTQSEIRQVAKLAFSLARTRKAKVSSVDKANVLECSRLWRETVNEVARHFPDVALEHVLVDAAAMFLITRPASFDVILTSNMFGDILTDEASVLAGSMGNLPSASLGNSKNMKGYSLGLYEPIHGSAPDIAGKGLANPTGTILSAALMLRHSFGLETEARTLEDAIEAVLSKGQVTADLNPGRGPSLSTSEYSGLVSQEIRDSETVHLVV